MSQSQRNYLVKLKMKNSPSSLELNGDRLRLLKPDGELDKVEQGWYFGQDFEVVAKIKGLDVGCRLVIEQ